MKLTGYLKDILLNIPTKFEEILKKLNFFCEILGILNNFDLRTIIYTLLVLRYMKFTRKKQVLVYNKNGLTMVKIYSTLFSLLLAILQVSHTA